MTEEERTVKERKDKEWVKARMNCTMESVFYHLARVVRYDVDAYNREGGYPEYKVEDATDGTLGIFVSPKIRLHSDQEDFVSIKCNKVHIRITNRQDIAFAVTPSWDIVALECKLWIDPPEGMYNVPLSYTQISQKAIGELLFKRPTYPPALK